MLFFALVLFVFVVPSTQFHYHAPHHHFRRPVSLAARNDKPTIRVCTDKDCEIDGSQNTLKMFKSLLGSRGAAEVTESGCLGPCGKGPNVAVRDENGAAVKDKRR